MENEIIKDKVSQGIMLMTEEKYEAAKKVFEEIIEINPRNLEAYIHLGNACANMKLYEEAIEALKKALMIDKAFSEAYFSIGSIYVLKNEKVKAVEYFNKAEENGFESSKMYLIMASIFFEADDEVQALRNISRAIQAEPFNGELRLFKVRIYLAFNKYDQAMETLDEMEKILPDAFEVYDLKSQIYLGQEMYSEAIEIIQKGCIRFPEDSNLAVIKLKVLVTADKYKEAHDWILQMRNEGLYDQVLKEATIHEATLLVKENKMDKACDLLIQSNESLENDPDLLYLIVDIQAKSAKNEEILKYSEKLMKEEYGEFYLATAMFFHATGLDALGKNEEAQKEFKNITVRMRKMTINTPSFYEGYLYRLLSHVKLKEFDKALDLTEYIRNLYPEKADAHAFRYYIFKEMGSINEADKEKELAKSINSNFNIL